MSIRLLRLLELRGRRRALPLLEKEKAWERRKQEQGVLLLLALERKACAYQRMKGQLSIYREERSRDQGRGVELKVFQA